MSDGPPAGGRREARDSAWRGKDRGAMRSEQQRQIGRRDGLHDDVADGPHGGKQRRDAEEQENRHFVYAPPRRIDMRSARDTGETV